MKEWHKIAITTIVCLGVGVILGVILRGCATKPTPPPESVVIHDTLIINDSSDIAAHTKPKYIVKWDTLYLPAVDKDSVGDSIAVVLPRESYEYRDTFETDSSRIELGVAFSGYQAKIDSIDLQYQFIVEPRTIEKKRGWGQFVGIGVGAGYGASVVGNTVYAAPEIGIHFVYGFGYHW